MLYCLVCIVLLSSVNLFGASFERVRFAQYLAYFEENWGQTDPAVRYLVRGVRGVSFLTGDSLLHVSEHRTTVSVRFALPNAGLQIEPLEPWLGTVNYFNGPEDGWKRNVPAFERVQYTGIRPNVDLIFSQKVDTSSALPDFTSASFVMLFVVRPGGRVDSLFLENSGGTRSRLNSEGAWIAEGLGFASITFSSPQAWQTPAGSRTPVDARFVAESESRVGIETAVHDSSLPLYIEVAVVSSLAKPPSGRFFVDASGNFYLAADVDSEQVCGITSGGTPQLCPDAVVAAFDPEGSPVFVTRLAGFAADSIRGIAQNAEGEVVIAGRTESADFPVSADALQQENAGPLGPTDPDQFSVLTGDLFVARLDARTGNLLYSTFFGGPQGEGGPILSVNPAEIAIAAEVGGSDFPVSPGAWMTQPPACPSSESYCIYQAVAKFDGSLKRVEYSTYLPDTRFPRWLAIHTDGSVYLAGSAEAGAITTPDSFQPEFGGVRDTYLLRIAPNGSQPLFATYFGGSQSDSAAGLVLDEQGNAGLLVLVRDENSSPPELTGLLAWVAADGSNLLSSQMLPAASTESARMIRTTGGEILLFNEVDSPVLPTSDDAPLHAGCATADYWYLTQLGSDGVPQLVTYLPQPRDVTAAIAVSPEGIFYLHHSTGFERVDLNAPNEPVVGCATGAASRRDFVSVSPGEIITLLGAGMGPLEGVGADPYENPSGPEQYPQTLGGVRVWVDGLPAPLLYVQASQINAVVPYAAPPDRNVTIEVEYEGRRLSASVRVVHGRVGLFSLDGSGTGPAAALNQDGTLNTQSNPAARGSIIVLFGTGVGPTDPVLPDGGLGPFSLDELARPTSPLLILLNSRTPADVLYAGSAPGLVNGLTQFNVRIPAALPLRSKIESVPVAILVDRAPAQNQVTVWVEE